MIANKKRLSPPKIMEKIYRTISRYPKTEWEISDIIGHRIETVRRHLKELEIRKVVESYDHPSSPGKRLWKKKTKR